MTSPARLARLEAVLDLLACPACLGALRIDGASLRCARGHAFDIARQGYAALATGASVSGDTAPMVRDRAAFLAARHYAAIESAVADAVPAAARRVADLASGPGTYLAAVLERRTTALGIALDVSAPAARLAAGAHPRAAAATADLRMRIPLATASVDAALIVFGPRNGEELARVLVPGGTSVVVVPAGDHLHELREPFGTLGVGDDKTQRVLERLRPLHLVDEQPIAQRRTLPAADVAKAVLMGPSGHHLDHERVRARAEELGPTEVTVSVRVLRFERAPGPTVTA